MSLMDAATDLFKATTVVEPLKETKTQETQKIETIEMKRATPAKKQEPISAETHIQKWTTFENFGAKISIAQLELLEKTARTCMRNRKRSKNEERERITSNSVLRALIDNFNNVAHALNLDDIQNEEELKRSISRVFKNYSH